MELLGLVEALTSLLALCLLLAALVVLGFVVDPSPHAAHHEATINLGPVELPADLPAPVRRHFESLSPGPLPRTETAIIWGRMRMKVFGLWMPMRMRSYFEAGRQFSRRMDVCWSGVPFMTAVDSYLDGVGRLQLRSETASNEAIGQGQRIALWAEAALTPSVYLTSDQVRWEPAGEHRARLKVMVDGGDDETLTWDFHPQTGRLVTITALRHRHGTPEKVIWRADYLNWRTLHGVLLPVKLQATWDDQGTPYAVMEIDGAAFNLDVAAYLRPPTQP